MSTSAVAVLLSLATLIAVARILSRQRSASSAARPSRWRAASLLALQPVWAGLLYLVLVPPAGTQVGGTLVVYTGGRSDPAAGAWRVALPEAGRVAGAEQVPDLATALRRYRATTVKVIGDGLVPRDRDVLGGASVSFHPGPAPRGITQLALPERTSPGSAFAVGGRSAGPGGAVAELLDPSGSVVGRTAIDGEGHFALPGEARVPGLAIFMLRISAAGRPIEEVAIPVWVTASAAVRVHLMATPGPEPKFLARWAQVAGLDFTQDLALGGGVTLGEPAPPLGAALLARQDVVIIDARRWAGLGDAGRSALTAAVRKGLGLMLLMDGVPDPATARQWRMLGWQPAGRGAAVPVALNARRPGVRADAADRDAKPTRWLVQDRGGVPLLRDAEGHHLAQWRPWGRGRIGWWAVADSYRLVLTGERERHAQWWSSALAGIARAQALQLPRIAPIIWAGQRTAVCDAGVRPRVRDAGGRSIALVVDPAAGGCAGYWPDRPGVHWLVHAGGEQPFLVRPARALPALQAQERRDATADLAARPMAKRSDQSRLGPASPWPWFFAWLGITALLWWLERNHGRVSGAKGGSRNAEVVRETST